LQGHCTRAPSYDPESEYLSFWLVDDTGEVRVSAYRAETRQIIAEGRVPAPGDLVEVAGTLRVREDFLALTIDVPEQLHVTRAEPVERAIGAIAPEDQYLRVRVHGQVRSLYEPYEGLTLFTVRDGSGSIPIAVSEDLVALSGISPTLSIGQSVEVVAAVLPYRGTPQLVPASVIDVVPLPDPVPIAAERRIGQLTTADAGQLVIVRGTITDVEPFSAGVKLTVDDTTGAIIVLLWQDVYDRLCGGPEPGVVGSEPGVVGSEPGVGAQIQVLGEVAQYRGQLEVIPELAEDVQVLVPATPSTSPTTIGALTSADLGRRVTLTGTLGPPEPFSAGTKFALDDGTGQITLLLWEDEYERAPDGLGAGAEVIVTGEVAEYQEELELIPLDATKIQVLSPGAAPQPDGPEGVSIGDVISADVGRTLTLSGTLGEMETFSKGVKFPLDDGTGTIVLLLWQEVYDSIPDAGLLVAGARVEVVGRIDEYQGELEIVPEAEGVRVTGGQGDKVTR
jgi:DNA/RNA endonuclease YhcR with UshA esterase domain